MKSMKGAAPDRGVQTFRNTQEIKKCTRCRVKRPDESPADLQRYQTCIRCRSKRRVLRSSANLKQPNMYTDFEEFLNKIKANTTTDILEHRYRGESDPLLFKRYSNDFAIDTATYQQVSRQLVEVYVHPLMEVTGYRLPIRDFHKGGRKVQRISFMFICSQDKAQQRKSRSSESKSVSNKLKNEDCKSKITLSYSLEEGIVSIFFNHKAHPPYMWKKLKETDESENDENTHQHHPSTEQQRSFDDLNFVEQLQQLQKNGTPVYHQQVSNRDPQHQSYQPQLSYDQQSSQYQYQRYPFFPSQQRQPENKSLSPSTESDKLQTLTEEEIRAHDAAAQIIAVAQQHEQQTLPHQGKSPEQKEPESQQGNSKSIDEVNIDKELIGLATE